MAGARGVRILGIDPGTLAVGFGCLEVIERGPARGAGAAGHVAEAARPQPLALSASNVVRAQPGGARIAVLEAGVLRLGGRNTPLEDRLWSLRRQFAELVERAQAEELALEEAFYGKSVGAALRIGEARGVVLAGAREGGLEVHQFAPARIKRAVAGHGAASKEAVARMVCRQLALSTVPKPRDVTDALAVAFCRAEERRAPFGP
jgi:crossover junction endodeoxyribonuclease RuvC